MYRNMKKSNNITPTANWTSISVNTKQTTPMRAMLKATPVQPFLTEYQKYEEARRKLKIRNTLISEDTKQSLLNFLKYAKLQERF